MLASMLHGLNDENGMDSTAKNARTRWVGYQLSHSFPARVISNHIAEEPSDSICLYFRSHDRCVWYETLAFMTSLFLACQKCLIHVLCYP